MNGPLAEGIVSDPDDPGEIKEKILKLLDRTRWSLLAREARQAAEKYTWDKYLDHLEQTLFECCGQQVPPQKSIAARSF
jgi:glycosyltransferase involved in cell wall biosynthesis